MYAQYSGGLFVALDLFGHNFASKSKTHAARKQSTFAAEDGHSEPLDGAIFGAKKPGVGQNIKPLLLFYAKCRRFVALP